MITQKCRMAMKRELEKEWEEKYFNDDVLGLINWYRVIEKPDIKVNGARALYQAIIRGFEKKGRHREERRTVKLCAVMPDEISIILKEIGDIGCVRSFQLRYGLEIEAIMAESDDNMVRKVTIMMVENYDEGIIDGENIDKEEERLRKEWQRKM